MNIPLYIKKKIMFDQEQISFGACKGLGSVLALVHELARNVSELRRQAASDCHEQVGPVEPVEPVEQVGEAVQTQFEQFGQFERVGQEDMQEDMLLSEIMWCAVCVGVIWGCM